MALYAIPTMNQGALPPGVAGESRDDLTLGIPVVITDAGPGPTREWLMVDRPEGSAAVLSTTVGITTQFTPDVAGSYRIRLTVNGGPTEDYIANVVAGIQIQMPSWLGAVRRLLRIPAWSETLDMNVNSSPAGGSNTRGWAQEMNNFLSTLAQYAFGFLAQQAGVPVGSEPFRTINFTSGTVTDAGGGVCNVNPSGGASTSVSYWGTTGDVGPTELFVNGVSPNRLGLNISSGMMCEVLVTAKDNTASQITTWRLIGAFRRTGAGNVVFVNQVKEVLVNELGAVDFNLSATGASIQVRATGLPATTLHWAAVLTYAESNLVI